MFALWLALGLPFLAACGADGGALPTWTPPVGTRPPATPPPFATLPRVASATLPPEPSATALAWLDLGLEGTLVFPVFDGVKSGRQELDQLDLASGAVDVLFGPPERGWLAAAAVAPDGSEIVIAYAPPPPEGEVQLGYTGLYVLPASGEGEPQVVRERTQRQESYFFPVWSPDGKYLYYVHFFQEQDPEGNNTYRYILERLAYPGGEPERLVENAIWPNVSPDGERLVYVSFEGDALSSNDLVVANLDGSGPRVILPATAFAAVDVPVFSPNGETIVFSAVPASDPFTPLSWLDQLLGVQVAAAHNVPSDLWRVAVSGGDPERLTDVGDVGIYPAYSPDGAHLAFVGSRGLFIANPDGSDLRQLLQIVPGGTLSWVP